MLLHEGQRLALLSGDSSPVDPFAELTDLDVQGCGENGNRRQAGTSWAATPTDIRNTVTGAVAATLFGRVAQAIAAGTIDIRPDRHFTWTPARYDQQAWDETIAELEVVFDRLPERQAQSSVRLEAEGSEAIYAAIGLMCFEAPAPVLDEGEEAP